RVPYVRSDHGSSQRTPGWFRCGGALGARRALRANFVVIPRFLPLLTAGVSPRRPMRGLRTQAKASIKEASRPAIFPACKKLGAATAMPKSHLHVSAILARALSHKVTKNRLPYPQCRIEEPVGPRVCSLCEGGDDTGQLT